MHYANFFRELMPLGAFQFTRAKISEVQNKYLIGNNSWSSKMRAFFQLAINNNIIVNISEC